MNTRLDPIQAGVLRVKLRYLDQDNAQRQSAAAYYRNNFAGLPVQLPQSSGDVSHVYHQYVIRTGDRTPLKEFLAARGIGTAIHYPTPIHQQPAYRNRIPIGHNQLQITEQLSQEILSLPMHPHLTDEELDRTTTSVIAYYQQTKSAGDFPVTASNYF